jgi:hypothetical protein
MGAIMDWKEFSMWPADEGRSGSLDFLRIELEEDRLIILFEELHSSAQFLIRFNSHLMARFSNESANFMEYEGLRIERSRFWISRTSNWIAQFVRASEGVFESLDVCHFLFVFRNASIEVINVGESPSVNEYLE